MAYKAGNETEMLSVMRKRLDQAISAYSESREDQLDDVRFAAGSPDNQWQWPDDVIASRGTAEGQSVGARPCLTINKLPQHEKQITNDQRQNRPSGKVIPANDEADLEVAEILDGIVRHIEYISDADVAYDTACENQVRHGEGYFRILTEYCDDDNFNQDIKIARIRNSFSVYMQPTIQDPCGQDAEWCFITQDMTHDEYVRTFPKAQPISSLQDTGVGDNGISAWLNEDTVRIAEYFYAEYERKTLNQYIGGLIAFSDSPQAKEAEAMGFPVTKSRSVNHRKICWVKTNGFEVLEKQDWAGKYIPVIRVIGNEFEVEGRLYISGIIRNAKDAQRMYNYWVSQEAEMLALAPKAPFIGYGGQFEGFETQWRTANVTNWPYLEVNSDAQDGSGAVLPLPQRAPPPLPQTGLIQAKMGASDDIKSTTGQYDASLGAEANEKSGRAIIARERQTDTGTYHYVDNLARAVRYCTRQIVDLIPTIYDTVRIARIIGLDGEVEQVQLDPTQAEAVRKIVDDTGRVIKKIYNPNIGKYDVRVTTGPSYMTKRQQTLEAMAQLLQGNPNLWAVAGDLFVKNMDWPGAEEMAERFKRTIPAEIRGDDEEGESEIPAGAKQAMQMASQHIQQQDQVIAEMQQVMQQMQQEVKDKAQAQETDEKKLEIEAYKAETERMSKLSAALTPADIEKLVAKTMHEIMTPQPLYDEGEPITHPDYPGFAMQNAGIMQNAGLPR